MDWAEIGRAVYNFLAGLLAAPPSAAGQSYTVVKPISETGYSVLAEETVIRSRLVARARNTLGIQYVWGGKDKDGRIETLPEGLDCSGEISLVYSQESYFTKQLPHGAENQFNFCKQEHAPLPGDLGFLKFISEKTGALRWHVGMLTDVGTVIHASHGAGKVIEESSDKFMARAGWIGWRSHPNFAQQA